MLLGDNVITWHSRKHDPPVWAVNSSATALSLCSHTTVSMPKFGYKVVRGFNHWYQIAMVCHNVDFQIIYNFLKTS